MNILTRIWVWLTGRSAQPAFPHLYWMLNSSWISQAVYVAARLDIAERLRGGPLSVTELAQQCQAEETPLLQVLRALAGFGVFRQDDAGRFALTPQAEPLLHDAPHSVHAYAILYGEQLYGAAGRMVRQVQTGEPAFKLHFGESIWDFYKNHDKEAETFDRFMSFATDDHNKYIVSAGTFSQYKHVVDVGAGRGSLLSAVLKANPRLKGTWFDRQEVLPEARLRLESEGLAERCDLIAGNFLDEIPSGADLYLIKHVLHDWSDDQTLRIVRNIADTMSENSRLIIVEAVLDPHNGRDGLCKLRDLEQMFWTGGRVRTKVEFENLLKPAGLTISKITRTPIVDVCLIEVVKTRYPSLS